MGIVTRTGFVAAALAALAYLIYGSATCAPNDAVTQARPGGPGAVAFTAAVGPRIPATPGPPIDIAAGTLRLEGVAVDEAGHALAGATVTLNRDRSMVTAAGGAFAFDHLADGVYRLSAESGARYAEDIVLLTERSDPLTLTLRGTTLVLHVVADGLAVADAHVLVGLRDADTDRTGTVSFRGLSLSGTTAEVVAKGYAPVLASVVMLEDPRTTIEKTITLRHGAPAGGVVVDQDGKPVPGAWLVGSMADLSWSFSTTADEEGRWHVDRLAAGKLIVHASTQAYNATPDLVVPVDGEHAMTDITVRVELGATITGVVVDGSGAPVPAAKVWTTDRTAETDDRGRFELTGVKAGTNELSARTETLVSAPQKVQAPERGRIRTRIVVFASSISGQVTNTRGDPVAEARVFAYHSDGDLSGLADATTDGDGRFELAALPPGEYRILAVHERSRQGWPPGKPVHPGDHHVALVLPDAARITGRVVQDGAPLGEFGVMVTDDAMHPIGKDLDVAHAPDGVFSQADLPPGTWSLVIAGHTFVRKVIRDVQVTEGSTTDLGDIVVDRGRTVSGRVGDERGLPVAGALVTIGARTASNDDGSLRPSAEEGVRTARSDDRGAFRVDGIDPGDRDLWISATDDQCGACIAAAEPLAPAATTIDLVIARTGAIAGTVSHPRGDLEVVVSCDKRGSQVVHLDAGNDFSVERVPPGECTIQLTGVHAEPVHVTVAAGATARADFALSASPIALAIHLDKPGGCVWMALRGNPHDDDSGFFLGETPCRGNLAEFPDVAPGRYRVCADFELCDNVEVTARPARQDMTLRPSRAPSASPAP